MDEIEMIAGTSPRIGQLTRVPSLRVYHGGHSPIELPLINFLPVGTIVLPPQVINP